MLQKPKQQRRARSGLWNYFLKIGSDHRALCSICQRDYSYKTTTANLATHLEKRHPAHHAVLKNKGDTSIEIDGSISISTPVNKVIKKPTQERRRSPIWKYFTDVENDDDTVKCKSCDWEWTFKGTIYNLKIHLKNEHYKDYLDYKNDSNKRRNSNESVDTTDDDSVSNSSVKFSTDICSYFEQFGDGSRCTICDQTTDNGIEEMRNHLEEEHPGILISILNNKEVMVNSDDDDTYTEVVYLDEEQKQTPVARKRRRTKDETIESKKETVEPKTPAKVSRPDIDSFLNYLGVLLHNVPKESMPKLQLDVISCVLNAQMIPINNEQSKACNCKETRDSQIDDSTKIIIVPST